MDFTYRSREPHKTVLYETVRDHIDGFLEICRLMARPCRHTLRNNSGDTSDAGCYNLVSFGEFASRC